MNTLNVFIPTGYIQLPFKAEPILFTLATIVCSLFWPFLICKFATEATDRVVATGFDAYDCDWFDLPPKLQEHMVLIILRSQDPPKFTGLNIVYCTLAVYGKVIISTSFGAQILFVKNYSKYSFLEFLKIIHSSCSYYMILRSLS